MNECILYGIRTPYVYEIIESINRLKITPRVFLDNLPDSEGEPDLKPLATTREINPDWLDLPVLFGTITPGYRRIMHDEAQSFGFKRYLALVDPTAVIASSAAIETGVQINAASVIGANTVIHDFALVNRSASVGHDVILEEFSTLGPACILCGSVVIGKGCFIGAGAVVTPGVITGKNSIIGAGAVVTKDVPDNCLAVGNPARIIRTGVAGYNGASV